MKLAAFVVSGEFTVPADRPIELVAGTCNVMLEREAAPAFVMAVHSRAGGEDAARPRMDHLTTVTVIVVLLVVPAELMKSTR
jgi:hypothetical protein